MWKAQSLQTINTFANVSSSAYAYEIPAQRNISICNDVEFLSPYHLDENARALRSYSCRAVA